MPGLSHHFCQLRSPTLFWLLVLPVNLYLSVPTVTRWRSWASRTRRSRKRTSCRGCSFFLQQICIFSASRLFLPQNAVFCTSSFFSASSLRFFSTSSFFTASKPFERASRFFTVHICLNPFNLLDFFHWQKVDALPFSSSLSQELLEVLVFAKSGKNFHLFASVPKI